ncbi:nucleotidyl transferase AbiEii/AbiGii toxin family protein [Nitrosopumilus ureiphilus]|uniref:Nucleotidyl transferase AbiEii/AbiGii toxin family protein n=1 Tax=Nitrosopumilus ureiphilus TaxID=1470067 RepID=A0A7D5M4T8_9ARCH|nr:nucleotidyl transferase AbiEii/AbiGii toxin family protein [Nitrosopumilus ureiphilus]QLH06732.1 hypothetical protein C5F50_06310 [Nitrosopumilus ureiphilus]
MRKSQVNEISRILRTSQQTMIEKDMIIHEILHDLSSEAFFSQNFIFKGGTCLVKTYIGYYRFSEDMDFTWKNQKEFSELSSKKLRTKLSELIDKTGKIFETISKSRNLDFKCDKSDDNYVELGGSNKMCTFKLWYDSEISDTKSFLKVQINFVEILLYSIQDQKLQSLGTNDAKIKDLFSEGHEYLNEIDFPTYDIPEILCEKIRAILTQKGTKARDFLDVYQICKKFRIQLEDIESNAKKKIKFSLETYEKYKENLKQKAIEIETGKLFEIGEENYILLEKINEQEFYSFNNDLAKFLNEIIPKEYHSMLYFLSITAVCSGGGGADKAPHKVEITNSGGKNFTNIDLTKEKCPKCGLVGTMQAMPGFY